jgi:tagatose-1,6-bisphosphate aldolase
MALKRPDNRWTPLARGRVRSQGALATSILMDYQVMFSKENRSQLEAFVRRVIADCQSGRATLEEGTGAIEMLVEAVKDGQWGDVQMWLQTVQDSRELIH